MSRVELLVSDHEPSFDDSSRCIQLFIRYARGQRCQVEIREKVGADLFFPRYHMFDT